MNKKQRKIFFYLVALAFFVLAPLLTLYTSGYRWTTEQGVVQLGGIIAETLPAGAQIVLDGVDSGSRTPGRIKELPPGRYEIELRKDGYRSWKKTIEVSPRQTNLLVNIALLKDSPATRITAGASAGMALSPDALFGQKLAYLQKEDSVAEVYEVALEGGAEATMLLRLGIDSQKADIELLGYSQNQRFLLVRNDEAFHVIDARQEESRQLAFDEDAAAEWARWSQDGRWILAKTASGVRWVHPSSMQAVFGLPSLPDQEITDALWLAEDSIFAIRIAAGTTQVLRYEGGHQDGQGGPGRVLFEPGQAGTWRFGGSGGGGVALLNEETGELLVIDSRSGSRLFSSRAQEAVWKDDVLYFHTQNEIALWRAQAQPSERLIARFGGRIEKAAPLGRTNHVAYLSAGQAFVRELDFFNSPNTHNLSLPASPQVEDFLVMGRDEGLLLATQEGIFLVPLR